MKLLPNCISFSRIIFSLILIYTKPLSLVFYVIYIICVVASISAIEELIIQLTSSQLELNRRSIFANSCLLKIEKQRIFKKF
ncbi:MAG: hypothetical protein F8N39_15960 [Clostridiaceae bacterium]|nr:hypothetical protein [Clostridiaceae bacterium]